MKFFVLGIIFVLVYSVSYLQFLKAKIYIEEATLEDTTVHEAAEETEGTILEQTEIIEEIIEEKIATAEIEPILTTENSSSTEAKEATDEPLPIAEEVQNTESPEECAEEKKTKFLPTADLAKKLEKALEELMTASKEDISSDQELNQLQKHTESLTEAMIKLAQMAETKIKVLEKQMNPEEEITPFSACRFINIYTFSPTTHQCVISSYEKCFGEELEELKNISGFFDLDTCQRYYGLTSTMTTKEQKAFDEQKTEYIAKLLELQEAYDYFSYNWNMLVDLVEQAGTYDTLSEAKDKISNFRLEQGKENF